ncbi:hypothetical protein [Kitasatospora albolonga]|uniref:VG15 protein n=1 Tax=Kitasatospora albolonga TaxID=68173 RepID=UPI0031F03C9E
MGRSLAGRLRRLFTGRSGTTGDTFRRAAAETQTARRASERLADRYYREFRAAEDTADSFPAYDPPRDASGLDSPELLADLEALEDEFRRDADSVDSGTAIKHALDGGRGVLADHIRRDPRAVGWQRVAGPGCCAFCAMLAARGAVYETKWTAGVGRSFHPHCACQVEPVFTRGTLPPLQSQVYAKAWRELSGSNLNQFRRELERLRREGSI